MAARLRGPAGGVKKILSARLARPIERWVLHFEASIEILGKLATLGAVPIRRRTTQVFSEFAQNIQQEFAKESS